MKDVVSVENIPAEQKSALWAGFKNAVNETYRLFPQIRDNVFFIESTNRVFFHPDKPLETETLQFINGSEYGQGYLREVFEGNKIHAGRAALHKPSNRFFVTFATETENFRPFGDDSPRDQNIFFLFDHELGHALVPQGYHAANNLRESIADAFALIRHYQRFGKDGDGEDKIIQWRYQGSLKKGEFSHFTGAAIKAIAKIKDETDFKSLSPQETIDLAHRIAVESLKQPNATAALLSILSK